MGETVVRGTEMGDFAATINTLAPGTDFTPALADQPGGLCQVPHWGYVIEGSMTIRYADGTEEELNAGDIFHLPAGHTALTTGGVQVAEFSPAEPMTKLLREIAGG
jgi:uncharacterized cupin superfamily protein